MSSDSGSLLMESSGHSLSMHRKLEVREGCLCVCVHMVLCSGSLLNDGINILINIFYKWVVARPPILSI